MYHACIPTIKNIYLLFDLIQFKFLDIIIILLV